MVKMFWTEEEKKILKKVGENVMSGKMALDDALKIFPGRSRDSIKIALRKMGLSASRQGAINWGYIKDLSKRGIKI